MNRSEFVEKVAAIRGGDVEPETVVAIFFEDGERHMVILSSIFTNDPHKVTYWDVHMVEGSVGIEVDYVNITDVVATCAIRVGSPPANRPTGVLIVEFKDGARHLGHTKSFAVGTTALSYYDIHTTDGSSSVIVSLDTVSDWYIG